MLKAFNLPINPVSFGQVSIGILREMHKRGDDVLLHTIANQFELPEEEPEEFVLWLKKAQKIFNEKHDRKNNIFKLWHIADSLGSLSEKQVLFSFYELDSPTKTEINIVKNNHKVLFSNEDAVGYFKNLGCDNVHYVPLGFDDHNFEKLDKKYFNDGRVVFSILGKFEKRKNHAKAIRAWVKRFGNNKKYALHCSIWNPFLKPEQNSALVAELMKDQKYWNVSFNGYMQKNEEYNDFLNSSNIVLAMSGGEGWGLPEFQSVAMGKHAVTLNCSGYKGWADNENSVLIQPNGKQPAYDGMFFKEGSDFNQGNIFDFDEDEFIAGCEEAIKRVEKNKVNKNGEKLKEKFTYSKMTDTILKHLE